MLLDDKGMTVLTLLQNAYPQFHPSSPLLLLAVVVPNRKAPVKAEGRSPRFFQGVIGYPTTRREGTFTCLKKLPASHGDRRLGALRPTLRAGILELQEH